MHSSCQTRHTDWRISRKTGIISSKQNFMLFWILIVLNMEAFSCSGPTCYYCMHGLALRSKSHYSNWQNCSIFKVKMTHNHCALHSNGIRPAYTMQIELVILSFRRVLEGEIFLHVNRMFCDLLEQTMLLAVLFMTMCIQQNINCL
jgi:hypothetical protein